MSQILIRSGDQLLIDGADGDVILQVDRIQGGSAYLRAEGLEGVSVKRGKAPGTGGDLQSGLNDMRQDILSLLAGTDAASSQEMLAHFVSDLFYALAQKRQKEERRQKQAEGIARAKAKGVQFGRAAKPLPDNFDACYQAWRQGEMTAGEAARICGMTRKAFYDGATRVRGARECAGSSMGHI